MVGHFIIVASLISPTLRFPVPSRALSWIQSVTPHLESLASGKGTSERKLVTQMICFTEPDEWLEERETELNILCAQLYQLLSIVQGVVLHHESSKAFLGRRYSLEVCFVRKSNPVILTCAKILTALLTTSRHTPMINHEPGAGNPATGLPLDKTSSVAHLSSGVLDSLLCILVDSSSALRVFEEVNGIQAIVKILKRAGTPREVRFVPVSILCCYC